MSEYSGVGEMHTVLSLSESVAVQPVVAFDIALGQRARTEDIIYDANADVLVYALRQGGLNDETIARHPVVFVSATHCDIEGRTTDSSPYNNDQPAIELAVGNDNFVSAQTVAHEAKHMADYIESPEELAQEYASKRLRKTGAVVAAMGLWATLNHNSGADLSDPKMAALAAIQADVYIACVLFTEYATRRSERVARKVERTVFDTSALTIEKDGQTHQLEPTGLSLSRRLMGTIKTAIIPDFRY